MAAGSAANYFPTRESLLEAIAERVSAMERDRFGEMAATVCPVTPAELGHATAGWVREATGARRDLTLARFAILVEAGHNTRIRRQLAETGSRVNAWFANWLTLIGSRDTGHDVHVLGNYLTGPGNGEPVEPSEAWTAIDDQRRALAHLLDGLSEQEWHHPSLCEGWTVRQVAAHLALQNMTWPAMPRAMLEAIRHGGVNGAIHAMACRHATGRWI